MTTCAVEGKFLGEEVCNKNIVSDISIYQFSSLVTEKLLSIGLSDSLRIYIIPCAFTKLESLKAEETLEQMSWDARRSF